MKKIIIYYVIIYMNSQIQSTKLYEFYRNQYSDPSKFYQHYEYIFKLIPISILRNSKIRTKQKNKALYLYGEQPQQFYYLVQGSIRLYTSASKNVRNKQLRFVEKSIQLTSTFFAQYQILLNRRRIQTVWTQTDVVLIQISKEYIQQIKFPKVQYNVIFNQLFNFTENLIPKLFYKKTFFKNSTYSEEIFPIAILIQGQFIINRSLKIIKQGLNHQTYQLVKKVNVFTMGNNQLLMDRSICKTSEAIVWVIQKKTYEELKHLDSNLQNNIKIIQLNREKIIQQRIKRLKQTYNYIEIEESLGVKVKHRTEQDVLNQQYEIKKLRQFYYLLNNQERANINSLHNKVRKIVQKPNYLNFPNLNNRDLYKLPIKNKKNYESFSSRKKTTISLQSPTQKSKKLSKDISVPMKLGFQFQKFELKMFYRQNRGKAKTGGFSFFKNKTKVKFKKSLIIEQTTSTEKM